MKVEDTLYIAHAADDRVTPVIAESAQECAKRAAEAFDLEYSASDISNWDRKSKTGSELHNWRITTNAKHWDYASIHAVEYEHS